MEGSAIEKARDIDVRVRHSKEAVLATTYELLSEEGLAGVSVDSLPDVAAPMKARNAKPAMRRAAESVRLLMSLMRLVRKTSCLPRTSG